MSGFYQKFYGLYFSSEDDLYDYINDPNYGVVNDMPYLCAAVTYTKGSNGEHNFKFHYYDWEDFSY